jgi:hypothetical protein
LILLKVYHVVPLNECATDKAIFYRPLLSCYRSLTYDRFT